MNESKPHRRTPWILIGPFFGLVLMVVMLPYCAGWTGTAQKILLVGSLSGGLAVGILIDVFGPRIGPPQS